MELPVSKKALVSAAARFGTPLYVYSGESIRDRVQEFQKAFAAVPHLVCYAMKANPNAAVCRIVAREGAGADVVSGGELWRALRAGFPPRRIAFSGVGKTEEEIAYGLKAGILLFNAESEEEIALMEKVAKRLKKKLPLSIRINPDIDPHSTHAYITTGKSENKFGIPLKNVPWVYRRAARSKAFDIKGAHIHLGSQIGSPDPYKKSLKALLTLVHDLKGHGIRLQYLDIGGGWGVPEGSRSKPVAGLADAIIPMLKGTPLTLLLEPGRCIVADAGVLLTRTLYRKQSRNKRFVVVDAAMNDLIRPTLYGAKHPIVSLNGSARPKLKADVVGPICESGDFLAQDATVEILEPGELYAILNAGAYGFSMSSQYNSRPRAAEVLADGSSLKLIRKRETHQDLVRNEL